MNGGGLQPVLPLTALSSEPPLIDELELDEEPPPPVEDDEEDMNCVDDPTVCDLLNAILLLPVVPLDAWFDVDEIFGIDCGSCKVFIGFVFVLCDCCEFVFDVTLLEVICEDEWIISGGTYDINKIKFNKKKYKKNQRNIKKNELEKKKKIPLVFQIFFFLTC